MKYKDSDRLVNRGISILLVFSAIITLYPIWNVLISSISSPTAISAGEVLFLPKGINFDGYRKVFENKQIWTGYRNSIVYTSISTMIDMLIQIPCAYVLSRKSLPGRKYLMVMFLITMYFKGGIIPEFLLINSLGWVDSPLALMIPGCVNVFNIIIAKSFFENSIPESLFDAARIDGCGYMRFFCTVVLPLSSAILGVIALYNIQAHWNAYLGAQMYLYSPEKYTLQQVIVNITAKVDSGLASSIGSDEYIRMIQEKQLLKYSVVIVSCLPLVMIYPFVQKFFVKGVMIGAVKE